LGIGANTAIFSVVNAALLQPLPYKNSEQLSLIWGDATSIGYPRGPISGPELYDLRRYATLFSSFGAIWQNTTTITGDGDPEELRIGWVTANFFRTLGVDAAIGRTFEDSDEQRGDISGILLSWPVWKRRYGGDPSIVGRTIMVWGAPTTVIGVMPPDFRLLFPREASVAEDLEAWIPWGRGLAERPRRQNFLRVVGRMKPGVGIQQAHEQVSQIAARISREYADYAPAGRKFNLVGLQSEGMREARPGLLALFAGVTVLLLTACLNVASLLIARAVTRTKETALRLAIGASHRQIVRQCLVEGVLLAFIGCVVGIAFGEISLRALVSLRPAALSQIASARIDSTVLLFTCATALIWGMLISFAPMVEVYRTDIIGSVLGNALRTRTPKHSTRAVLVTLQIAMSVVLLVGAGLMIRTFIAIQRLDPGYTPDHMLSFRLSPPFGASDSQQATNDFHRRLQISIASLPAITGIGAASHLPFDTIPNWGSPYFIAEGQDPSTAPFADYRAVSPGYLEAIGAHLLEGRFFSEDDNSPNAPVVIVDELLARKSWKNWPAETALGKRIKIDPSVSGRPDRRIWFTVVGVVRHMRLRSLVEDLTDQVYMTIRQASRPTTYVVKTTADPAAIAGSVRERIREFEPKATVYDIHPLDNYLIAAKSGQRFVMYLAAAFALVALALAFVGVFGLVSYAVNMRRYEFGVRLALGAHPRHILRLVVRERVVLLVAGLTIGVAIAGMVAQFLQSQLFGVTAFDISTYMIAMAVITIACSLASWLPARKAASSNVLDVMREL